MPTGSITRSDITNTSLSLRAMAAHGIEETSGVDVDMTASFLADLAAADGEYWPDPSKAGQAVLGLAAVDELDRIDAGLTRDYIERNRLGSGGFAGRGFYAGYTAMHRHASAVSALTLLGGDPDATDAGASTSGDYAPGPSVEEVYGVATVTPGRGMTNHRSVLVDPEQFSN